MKLYLRTCLPFLLPSMYLGLRLHDVLFAPTHPALGKVWNQIAGFDSQLPLPAVLTLSRLLNLQYFSFFYRMGTIGLSRMIHGKKTLALC